MGLLEKGCAISKGMRIKYSEGLIAGETEQGVFEALGLPCPLPSEREIVDGKPVWMQPENCNAPITLADAV